MIKKRRLFLIITIIFVLVTSTLVGCSSKKEEKAKETSKPAPTQKKVTEEKKYGNAKGLIWEIKKDKATVYLFGSIHVAKKDMYPFDKTVEDAFSSSNNLVVEAILSNNTKASSDENELMYPENDDVYNHISKEEKEKLDASVKELGMNMDMLKKMKLSVIISAIGGERIKSLGYYGEYGVDVYFKNKAKDKKILELEGEEFQEKLLHSISEEEQKEIFFSNIKSLKETEGEYNKLFEAYKAGDEKEIVKLNGDPLKLDAGYYKKMIVDRNIGMAEKIDGYLKTNDSYFVVTGFSHFIGDDSVVKLLEKKGYTVKRLK